MSGIIMEFPKYCFVSDTPIGWHDTLELWLATVFPHWHYERLRLMSVIKGSYSRSIHRQTDYGSVKYEPIYRGKA